MEGMREREYSAHSGLSRGAIQKARKTGRMVVYKDGSINAAGSDVSPAEMKSSTVIRQPTANFILKVHRSSGVISGLPL